MPKWLWWFLEPFTKTRYEQTSVDEMKASLFIIICLAILCLIGYLIYELWYKIHRLMLKKKYNKPKRKRYRI